jgi:hypothetical protein
MSLEFFTSIDLEQNEIQNVALQNLAAPPATPAVAQIYFDTTLGFARIWDGTTWTAAGTSAKFATNIGNGVALSFVVTHNLNTRDFVASVFNNTTFNEVVAVVQHTTLNTATFTFTIPPLLNQYRVVIEA